MFRFYGVAQPVESRAVKTMESQSRTRKCLPDIEYGENNAKIPLKNSVSLFDEDRRFSFLVLFTFLVLLYT